MKTQAIRQKLSSRLVLLILYAFFTGIFVSIYFSVANAEFVSNFGSDILPVGYLLSGLIGYFLVSVYRSQLRNGGYNAFSRGTIFLLSCTLLFRFALYFTSPEASRWMSFLIFLFAMPFLSLAGLSQAGLLLKSYDLRESKIYAGIINAGGTAAAILGYLSIPLLLPFLSSRFDLFYVAAAGLAFAFYYLTRIHARFNLGEIVVAVKITTTKSESLFSLLKQRYLRYIAICGGLSMIAFYLVDYSFLMNAKKQTSSPAELTALIGGFFGIIKTAELVLSLLSGRIYRSYGLKTGILILPVVCVFISVLAILMHTLNYGFVFLMLIFCLKFFERCLSKALEEPAFKNLYQLLDVKSQLSTQARIDGNVKQISIVFGSIMLIVFGALTSDHYQATGLLYLSVVVFVIWLFFATRLVHAFRNQLRELLHPGGIFSGLLEKRIFHQLPVILRKRGYPAADKKTAASALLGHVLEIEDNHVTPFGKYDQFVPAPVLQHLVSPNGRSRLELQLDHSMLFMQPFPYHLGKVVRPDYAGQGDDVFSIALAGQMLPSSELAQVGRMLDSARSPAEKKILLYILEKSNDPLSLEILLSHLSHPEYDIKKQVFDTLEQKNFKAGTAQDSFFIHSAELVLADLAFILSAQSSLDSNSDLDDLHEALQEEETMLKWRLLSILTWKYDRGAVMVVRDNLFMDRAEKHSNTILALELIDNLVVGPLKPQVMAVFEGGTAARRLQALSKWHHFPQTTSMEMLNTILHFDYTRLSVWTKACALRAMAVSNIEANREAISAFRFHPHPLLRALSTTYLDQADTNIKANAYLMSPLNKKDQTSLKMSGADTYQCVKLLKQNRIFETLYLSDLLTFCMGAEYRKNESLRVIGGKAASPDTIVFVAPGSKVMIEFSEQPPLKMFQWEFVSPNLYSNSKLTAIFGLVGESYYTFSAESFFELVLSNDALLDDVMKHLPGLSKASVKRDALREAASSS